MQLIRGFVTKSTFINNTLGQIAPVYELSPFAMTYTRERGEYTHSNYLGNTLHTFTALDGTTGEHVELTAAQVEEVFLVTAQVQSYFESHPYPFDLDDFQNVVLANLGGSINLFRYGTIETGVLPVVPDWISWWSNIGTGAEFRIWFKTESFENQYSYYDIIPVAPIDDLDRFFGTYGDLATQLNAMTVSEIAERAMDARDNHPETYLRFYTFKYYNPINPAQWTNTTWGVLVYGKNGDNIDSIKDAIVEHVLANSSYTQAQWEDIFPDLFKRTEFLIYPRWDKIAIPNLTEQGALYSTMMDPVESVSFAIQKWNTINPAFIEANLTLFPYNYKALSLLCLNGQSNLFGYTSLRGLFPDYIPVSTSSVDFNRMSLSTRNWLLAIQPLILAAETATEYTSLQNPLRRVIRDGVLYITLMYDNVNYLVAAKSNG